MSAEKRGARIVGIPNVPLTQRGYMTVDKMDDVYGSNSGAVTSPNDPLAQMEREETAQALKELRDLQVQKKTKELQNRIEKEKAEIEGGSTVKGLYNFTAADIAAISKMGDAEKQGFFQTVQMINSMAAMQTPGGGGQNPMLALALAGGLGGGGRQQGLTAKDVLDIGAQYANLYQGAGKGDGELSKTLLLNLLTQTLPQWQNSSIQNMQMAYQAQIAQLQQNQADPLRDLKYLKEGAEALGYKPMSASTDIEKLRIEMENTWKGKEFDLRVNELNYSRQLGLIKEIMNNPLVEQLAKGFGRSALGGPAQTPKPVSTVAEAPNPLGPPQMLQAPQEAAAPQDKKQPIIMYTCPNCKAQIYAPLDQTQVTCTSCGGSFPVDPQASIQYTLQQRQGAA
jgi:hypothetical protein